jgi:hypothetical protein
MFQVKHGAFSWSKPCQGKEDACAEFVAQELSLWVMTLPVIRDVI